MRRVLALALVVLAGCSSHHAPGAVPSGTPAPSAPVSGRPGATPTGSRSVMPPASGSAAPSGTATAPATSSVAPSPSGTLAAAVAPLGAYDVAVAGGESYGPQGSPATSRTYPTTSTVEVRAGDTATRRVLVVRYDDGRSDTITLDLAGGAVRLVRTDSEVTTYGFAQHQVLEPSPPVVLLPSGAKVGQKFSGTYGGASTGSWSGTVARRERLVIGGRTVDTLVVDETVTAKGSTDATTTSRTWWDPVRLMPVKQQSDTTARAGSYTYAQHVTVTLRSLAPR